MKGARILLSTKTANRIIADVYAVRSDYFESESRGGRKIRAAACSQGEDALRKLVANKDSRAGEYKDAMSAAAAMLLDSPQAIADTEGMYARCRVRAA